MIPADLKTRYEHLLAVRNNEPTYTYFQPTYNFEIALMERIAAAEWQPITAENKPEVGDEVAEYIFATVDEPYYWIVSEVDYEGGWSSVATHFRPINPPKESS